MSRNIATKVTDMLSDWARKDTEAQTEAVTRLGLPKNNTAKDRAKAMGFGDETYYHGSVKDITEFDPSMSNIEGHLGKSIYVTDNPLDASRNYASLQSPDLTVKAENMAERMDDTAWLDNFKDNDGIVYPLSIRKGNQLDVSRNSVDDIDFNPVYDDVGEEIIEENQNLQNLHDSLYRQSNQYDFNFDRASSQLDDFYDLYPASGLDNNLRGNDALFDAQDDVGNLANNEIRRQIYEDMGYDSVKMNANDEFGKLMQGIDDTNHHMIFDPANIRSKFAHFNPKMAGVGAGAIMSSNLMASDAEALPVTKVDDMLKAWAKADKEAQQEAVKRLGLGADNTAKDRAKAMGFGDETYYHGTSHDFDEFNDVTTYVSPSPKLATDFAFMDNAGGYALDGVELTDDMLYNKRVLGGYSKPNIMPLKVRANETFDNNNPYAVDELKGSFSNSEQLDNIQLDKIRAGNYADVEDAIPVLKKKQYDSALVKENESDGFAGDVDNLAIFNPNGNIRSPLAHFNPKMAGIGAGAVMSGNLMADELDLEYKGQEPSAWDSLMNTIGGVNQEQAQAYGDTGAGAINIATMLATDPAVAGEVISTVGLKGVGAVSPYIKGFGAGLLLDSGEASASPMYTDEDFINKLEGR